MKKAFDQNVSRAKPRLRLGAQIMETADAASAELVSPPPAPVPDDAPVARVTTTTTSRVEETVVFPAELLDPAEALESEVKSRVERSRQARPAATEALQNALSETSAVLEKLGPGNGFAAEALHARAHRSSTELEHELSTVRAEPPPRREEYAEPAQARRVEIPRASAPPPQAQASVVRRPVTVEAHRAEEAPIPETFQPAPRPPIEEMDPASRRERLKERLKAVRENPRPEPLPPSVAQAGVLAVERIASLQTELYKIKSLNLALTQDLEGARRQAEKATEEARARMDEARRLSGETESRSKLLSELERELSVLEGERDEALLSLQEARQALLVSDQEKEILKQEISQRDQSLADSLTEEERLAGELEEMQAETSSLRKSLEVLGAEREMLARQVADLTTERAELLEARRALESVHRALSQAMSR
jgi:hypothetical protein